MKSYQVYINGKFSKTESDKVLNVANPASGKVFAQVPDCNQKDVDIAVNAAAVAQTAWKHTSPVKRAEHMRAISSSMRKNVSRIAIAITLEQGKSLNDAEGEVLEAADLLDYHAEWARRIEGELVQSDSTDENIIVYKEPLGVVACILPWNFPIYVMIRKLGPALITGNTVILKPSSETPTSVLEFMKTVDEANVPVGVINAVTGSGRIVGGALVRHPKVAFVSLTGSVEAGKEILKASAENITKVSLELGGKAPAIVMADADLALAVDCIKRARLSNAGQVCTCTERVYVHETVIDDFIRRMKDTFSSVTMGDGFKNPAVQMGPLINQESVARVQKMVKNAVDNGAEIICGGESYEGEGAFMKPVLLTGCTQDSEIIQEEVFGPVLPVIPFKTKEEALEYANDCQFGLASTLFTEDLNTVMYFSNNIEFGELYINRKQGEPFQGYHAGWKKSGIGGDDGKHGLDEYLQTRVVYIKYR